MRVMMMAVAATALAVSACGGAGGGKAALVAECVKEGEDRKNCQCVADELEKNLDKDAFRAIVLAAQGKEDEADKIMNNLSMEKQMSVLGGAMSAAMKCGANFM